MGICMMFFFPLQMRIPSAPAYALQMGSVTCIIWSWLDIPRLVSYSDKWCRHFCLLHKSVYFLQTISKAVYRWWDRRIKSVAIGTVYCVDLPMADWVALHGTPLNVGDVQSCILGGGTWCKKHQMQLIRRC